jgi:hypothetical protein
MGNDELTRYANDISNIKNSDDVFGRELNHIQPVLEQMETWLRNRDED